MNIKKWFKTKPRFWINRDELNKILFMVDKEHQFNGTTKVYLKRFNKFDVRKFNELEVSIVDEITESEYLSQLKNTICDCPVGEGYNIKHRSKDYSSKEIIEIFKVNFPDYDIEIDEDIYEVSWTDPHQYGFRINNYHLVGIPKNVPKSACLNCRKCLDGKKGIYDKFEEAIKKIQEDEKQDKLINEICGE